MLRTKICLSLLIAPTVGLLAGDGAANLPQPLRVKMEADKKPPEFLINKFASKALETLVSKSFDVAVNLIAKKMIFDSPKEEKQSLAVYRQVTRLELSRHYEKRIKELLEQQKKDNLTEKQKELLDTYQAKYEELELAILHDKASGLEKPGRELATTGWLAKKLRPVVQVLPG